MPASALHLDPPAERTLDPDQGPRQGSRPLSVEEAVIRAESLTFGSDEVLTAAAR